MAWALEPKAELSSALAVLPQPNDEAPPALAWDAVPTAIANKALARAPLITTSLIVLLSPPPMAMLSVSTALDNAPTAVE